MEKPPPPPPKPAADCSSLAMTPVQLIELQREFREMEEKREMAQEKNLPPPALASLAMRRIQERLPIPFDATIPTRPQFPKCRLQRLERKRARMRSRFQRLHQRQKKNILHSVVADSSKNYARSEIGRKNKGQESLASYTFNRQVVGRGSKEKRLESYADLDRWCLINKLAYNRLRTDVLSEAVTNQAMTFEQRHRLTTRKSAELDNELEKHERYLASISKFNLVRDAVRDADPENDRKRIELGKAMDGLERESRDLKISSERYKRAARILYSKASTLKEVSSSESEGESDNEKST